MSDMGETEEFDRDDLPPDVIEALERYISEMGADKGDRTLRLEITDGRVTFAIVLPAGD